MRYENDILTTKFDLEASYVTQRAAAWQKCRMWGHYDKK